MLKDAMAASVGNMIFVHNWWISSYNFNIDVCFRGDSRNHQISRYVHVRLEDVRFLQSFFEDYAYRTVEGQQIHTLEIGRYQWHCDNKFLTRKLASNRPAVLTEGQQSVQIVASFCGYQFVSVNIEWDLGLNEICPLIPRDLPVCIRDYVKNVWTVHMRAAWLFTLMAKVRDFQWERFAVWQPSAGFPYGSTGVHRFHFTNTCS